MKMLKNIFLLAGLAIAFTACERDVTVDSFANGDASFNNYVALGNSLTAGFNDGALYLSSQSNSYPQIMADQFAKAGGGSFTQPLVADELGGLTLGGNVIAANKLELVLTPGGPVPSRVAGMPSTEVGANIAGGGPYNNLGIPGAKSFHLLGPDYGAVAGLLTMPATANPYYVRFSKPGTSLLAEAVSQSPSFYSVWIGNNDVLGYATSGGEGDVITDQTLFGQAIGGILQGMASTGAKGVIANIPSVTDIPFFTTVPNTPVPLDAATAGGVNQAYAAYNGGLDQLVLGMVITQAEADLRKISFSEGNNAPVFIDNGLTDLTAINPALISMRQVKPGELITLPASSVLGSLADPANPASVIGVGVPLGAEFVLTSTELTNISTAIAGFNATIDNLGAQFGVPVADMNGFFSEVAGGSGITFNGADYSTTFATGGLFSLELIIIQVYLQWISMNIQGLPYHN